MNANEIIIILKELGIGCLHDEDRVGKHVSYAYAQGAVLIHIAGGSYYTIDADDSTDEKVVVEKLVRSLEWELGVAFRHVNHWTQVLGELEHIVKKTKHRGRNLENIRTIAMIAKCRGVEEITFDQEDQELYFDDITVRFRYSTTDESVISLDVVKGIAQECGVNVVEKV